MIFGSSPYQLFELYARMAFGAADTVCKLPFFSRLAEGFYFQLKITHHGRQEVHGSDARPITFDEACFAGVISKKKID